MFLFPQVIAERDSLPDRPPLLVKIAPDLTEKDKEDIAAVVTRGKVCMCSPDTVTYVSVLLLPMHAGWADGLCASLG